MNSIFEMRKLVAVIIAVFSLCLACSRPGGNGAGQKAVQTDAPALTAFNQEVTVSSGYFVPSTVAAKAHFELSVSVKNTGSEAWIAQAPDQYVAAGYRWFTSTGELLTLEGRTRLAADLSPSQSASLKLDVQVPDNPGTYKLVVSMVQEHVAWFFTKGSSSLELPMLVTGL